MPPTIEVKKRTVYLVVLLAGICLLWMLYNHRPFRPSAVRLAEGWSQPVKVTDSKDSLVGGVILHQWHGSLVAFQGHDDLSARGFLMESNMSWKEVSLTGVPREYRWSRPTFDDASESVFFQQGYLENERLFMSVLVGRCFANANVGDVTEIKWTADKNALFGTTGTNIEFGRQGGREPLYFDQGVFVGRDRYITYCLNAVRHQGNTFFSDEGPFSDGVFHSDDSGKTWQIERISDQQLFGPLLCKSEMFCYYFATRVVMDSGRQLWFSRKPVAGGTWTDLNPATKTVANAFVALAEGDAIHLCWLDRRHEKTRLNPVYPDRGNFEVAYGQMSDSDSKWSKDVILSKGLLYSFSPSMAVEGQKLVIVWSGIETAPDWHTSNGPNDIYYVTSKDGGKTWSKMLKVTNEAKDGITSGMPQVALLNGVIHLLYIQGKNNLQQTSPGLTKLNQPPWPIYHVQRPFPD
jgi:hypothetical protein